MVSSKNLSTLYFPFQKFTKSIFLFSTYLLLFLVFFGFFMISICIQSSFIGSYYSTHPLELSSPDSVVYTFSSVLNYNNSNIPVNILSQLNSSINNFLEISGLSPYVDRYEYYISFMYVYHYYNQTLTIPTIFLPDSLFKVLNPLFINQNFSVNTFPFSGIFSYFPSSADLELHFTSSIIGNNLTLLPVNPYYNITSDCLLNLTISNFFTIDDFTINHYLMTKSPLLYRIFIDFGINTNSYTYSLFLPFSELYSVITYYQSDYLPFHNINVQFYYNFCSVCYSDYKKLYSLAAHLDEFSGYSEDFLFKVQVSNELSTFMDHLQTELNYEWWSLFCFSFPLVLFSFYCVWLSLDSQKGDLKNIFAVSILKGFPQFLVFRGLFIFYFLLIALASIIGYILAIGLNYITVFFLNHYHLTAFPISFSVPLNSVVIITFFSIFGVIFLLTALFLIFYYKNVQHNISKLVSRGDFYVKAKVPLLFQLIAILIGSMSLIWLIYISILYKSLSFHLGNNEEIKFFTLASNYIIGIVSTFSILLFLLPIFLSVLINFLHKLSFEFAASIGFFFRSLIANFAQFRKQSFLNLIAIFLVFQSIIIPTHLYFRTQDSAKFSLGADISVNTNNATTVEQLLPILGTDSYISSYGNYTLLSTTISDNPYYILSLSPNAIQTLFLPTYYAYGFTYEQLLQLQDRKPVVLLNKEDPILRSLHNRDDHKAIFLSFNNLTALPKIDYITKESYIAGTVDLFPIISKNNSVSGSFIICSEFLLKELLNMRNFIHLSIIEQNIIANVHEIQHIDELKNNLTIFSLVSVVSWLDLLPSYQPLFSGGIFSLFIFSTISALIFLISLGCYQTRDYILTQQDVIMALKNRGFQEREIFTYYLLQWIFHSIIISPIAVLMGFLFLKAGLMLVRTPPSPLITIIYQPLINWTILVISIIVLIQIIIQSLVMFYYCRFHKIQLIGGF